jgi:hypothetical protein
LGLCKILIKNVLFFLEAFVKSRKVAFSFVMSVLPSALTLRYTHVFSLYSSSFYFINTFVFLFVTLCFVRIVLLSFCLSVCLSVCLFRLCSKDRLSVGIMDYYTDIARYVTMYTTCKTLGRDSSIGIATQYGLDWTVRGLNPGRRLFTTGLTPALGPPSLIFSWYRVSFPEVKRPGRGFNHPPPSSAEVKEIVEL